MKVYLLGNGKARLVPTGGSIRDRFSGRSYSEAVVSVSAIHRYEDADSVTYETVDATVLPEDVRAVFDQVVGLIVGLAGKYDAVPDLKALPNISISSLFRLADAKHVSDQDMTDTIMQVVMLKTDIEARIPRSWYDLWNGNLKPYIGAAIAAQG